MNKPGQFDVAYDVYTFEGLRLVYGSSEVCRVQAVDYNQAQKLAENVFQKKLVPGFRAGMLVKKVTRVIRLTAS